MCECLDYDDGTRHTCEACVGDLEMLRDALSRSERRAAEAEAEINYWLVKARCYGDIVHGCSPALAAAGFPVDATQNDGAVGGIARSVNALASALASERAAREKAERERDEARDNLKLVKWTPNDDRMMEMLVAEKERDEYGARLARVEAALLSLAKVGEDDDGQPVLRISCGFHCETADMTELPLVWAALAEIGGKR